MSLIPVINRANQIRNTTLVILEEEEIYTDNQVLFTDNENVYSDGILINL